MTKKNDGEMVLSFKTMMDFIKHVTIYLYKNTTDVLNTFLEHGMHLPLIMSGVRRISIRLLRFVLSCSIVLKVYDRN